MLITVLESAARDTDPDPAQLSVRGSRAIELTVDATDVGVPRLLVATTVPGAVATAEVQTVTYAGGALDSGTWTLTVDAEETDPIDFDDNAAAVQSALEALDGVGTNDIAVSGGPLGVAPFTFTWAAFGNQGTLVADASSLVTLAAPEIVVTVSGVDTLSGKTFPLLDSTAINTVSQTQMRLGPELAAGDNVANSYLPDLIEVTVAHDNADSITYSVNADIIR